VYLETSSSFSLTAGNVQVMPRRRTGRWLRLPYDWRRPTRQRLLERAWNPDDPRLLTPKAYGWGLGVNAYWLVHPLRWRRARRR
jgi:hypothetical protein